MNIDDFQTTAWRPGMQAAYKNGSIYKIAAVDFDEALVALDGLTLGTDEPTWVRCENITLVEGGAA